MLPLAKLEFCTEPKTGMAAKTPAPALGLSAITHWRGVGAFDAQASWAVVESARPPASVSDSGLTAELVAMVRRTLRQLNLPGLETMVASRRIFALNLTTATAMKAPIAPRFFAALKQQLGRDQPPNDGGDTIEFCLTEVITNAIIHGNLGFNPLWSFLPEEAGTANTGTANTETPSSEVKGADSRLTVLALLSLGRGELGRGEPGRGEPGRLEIIVSDEGEKFSHQFIPSLPFVAELLDNRSPRGRGLALIRELGVELGCVIGNNSVRLSFPWHP